MPGQNFERKVFKILEKHIADNKIEAYPKRISQTRWHGHHIDLEVDSALFQYYLGIECKSVEIKRGSPVGFYYSSHFSYGQFDNINDFINRSGRRGFLALEVIHYTKNRDIKKKIGNNKTYFIKWEELIESAGQLKKALWLDEVNHVQLKKINGDEFNVEEAIA